MSAFNWNVRRRKRKEKHICVVSYIYSNYIEENQGQYGTNHGILRPVHTINSVSYFLDSFTQSRLLQTVKTETNCQDNCRQFQTVKKSAGSFPLPRRLPTDTDQCKHACSRLFIGMISESVSQIWNGLHNAMIMACLLG